MPLFVLGADEELRSACRAALEQFPSQLELDYEDLAQDEVYLTELRRKAELWAEFGRQENYATAPVPNQDGMPLNQSSDRRRNGGFPPARGQSIRRKLRKHLIRKSIRRVVCPRALAQRHELRCHIGIPGRMSHKLVQKRQDLRKITPLPVGKTCRTIRTRDGHEQQGLDQVGQIEAAKPAIVVPRPAKVAMLQNPVNDGIQHTEHLWIDPWRVNHS